MSRDRDRETGRQERFRMEAKADEVRKSGLNE